MGNADETGWREEDKNGNGWILCTPPVRYFLRRSHRNEVIAAVLGDDLSGVLVSDFFGAYDYQPGVKPRCWAHLLRDIHESASPCSVRLRLAIDVTAKHYKRTWAVIAVQSTGLSKGGFPDCVRELVRLAGLEPAAFWSATFW